MSWAISLSSGSGDGFEVRALLPREEWADWTRCAVLRRSLGEEGACELESNLVKYLLEGQRFAQAEPLLLAMHKQVVERSDESSSQTQASIERLANLYESWHAAEPGKGYDAKASEWRAKLPPPQAPTKP